MSRYSSIGWHDEPEESGSIIAFRYPVILSILLFVIGKYILPSGPLSIWPTARPTTGLRQSYTLIGMEKISSTSSWKIAQSNEEYCVDIYKYLPLSENSAPYMPLLKKLLRCKVAKPLHRSNSNTYNTLSIVSSVNWPFGSASKEPFGEATNSPNTLAKSMAMADSNWIVSSLK